MYNFLDLIQKDNLNLLYTLILLILLDTLLGVLNAIHSKELNSKVGRRGLSLKLSEIIICIFFSFLSLLNNRVIPDILTIGIFMFFIIFELTSIAENLKELGFDIPILTKYIESLKEEQEEEFKKEVDEMSYYYNYLNKNKGLKQEPTRSLSKRKKENKKEEEHTPQVEVEYIEVKNENEKTDSETLQEGYDKKIEEGED